MKPATLAIAVGSMLASTRAQTANHPPVPGTQIPGVRVPTIYDRPLDQGIADLDELATSLREMPGNLRQDRNFEFLWALPGNPDYLYRKDGGLTAVFPASEYSGHQNGAMVLIPAGTIFYIGDPRTPPSPPQPGLVPANPDESIRFTGNRLEPEPAHDRLEAIPPAEKITAQIAASPERRVITPQLASEALELPPAAEDDTVLDPLREDEHTMSNEAYRRLRLRNLTIRLADAGE